MLHKVFGYCLHSTLSKIDNGYQYCNDCGKAIPVEPPHAQECQHKWKEIGKLKKRGWFGRKTDLIFYLQCDNCGDIKATNSKDKE
jgi:Fe2+ or Zn2+ uptake regulation protein